jgi:hypothetical protein
MKNKTQNKMKKNFLFLIVASSLVFTACKKKGCTDADANNYLAEAEKDDGTCTYNGHATFWFDQATSITQNQAGTTTIEIFVGDVSGGSLPVADYAGPATPDCGDAKTIAVVKNLGAESAKSLDWEAKDQSGTVLYSGTWAAEGKATSADCMVININP